MNIRIFITIVIVILLIFFIVEVVNGGRGLRENTVVELKNLKQRVRISSNATEEGNRVCPVSGLKIWVGKEIKYEYKGKIYNFFSTPGVEEFKKNPEKYIQILESWKKIITKEKLKINDYYFKSQENSSLRSSYLLCCIGKEFSSS